MVGDERTAAAERWTAAAEQARATGAPAGADQVRGERRNKAGCASRVLLSASCKLAAGYPSSEKLLRPQ